MITTNFLELTPAYGRDYKNKAAVEADFRAGKDVHIPAMNNTLCSIADFAPGVTVNLRYNKNRSVLPVKV